MNKDFITDYLGCILFRLFAPVIRALPEDLTCFAGRKIGELVYYLDAKHRAVAYANIKAALGDKLSVRELNTVTRDFYRSFAQNIMEIFFIPKMDRQYLEKYIKIEGLDYVRQAFEKKKGVIFVGAHAGSWELSNIVCANLGFPFNLFVQEQRMPRLNRLLNSYRVQKGCKIIQKKNQTRRIIEVLRNNESIGMTVDQGGKTGVGVKFFGKDASMSTGAVRLALKYGSPIIPAFFARQQGRFVKIILAPPFEVRDTGNPEEDIRDNLQELIHIYEKFITTYPQEYLWTYKIWKYSKERNILILNDGKTGHLRQSQSLAGTVKEYLREKNISANTETADVKFKSKFSRKALSFCGCLSGKYVCQGCLGCMKAFLSPASYGYLTSRKPDIIISCGSSLAAVNLMLSRHNLAKSLVVLKPSLLPASSFDLVVMPKHDNPAKRKNIAVTQGALNLIDAGYLEEEAGKFLKTSGLDPKAGRSYIGLLLGGQTKSFHLEKDTV
ncbi:MAG: ELM1/GtrOC1 family putative glycosyltransferase, partial [Candidatus Omnitrophica bacterium]|nr:ELM1/GtrOC1 family putative glycosyltransferase [Candidatus Omnitrophota bacterium]